MSKEKDLKRLRSLRTELEGVEREEDKIEDLEIDIEDLKDELKNPEIRFYKDRKKSKAFKLRKGFLEDNDKNKGDADVFGRIWLALTVLLILAHLFLLFAPAFGIGKIPLLNILTYITPAQMAEATADSHTWNLILGVISSLIAACIILKPLVLRYLKGDDSLTYMVIDEGIHDLSDVGELLFSMLGSGVLLAIAWVCDLIAFGGIYECKNYNIYFIAIYFISRIAIWFAVSFKKLLVRLEYLSPSQRREIKLQQKEDLDRIIESEFDGNAEECYAQLLQRKREIDVALPQLTEEYKQSKARLKKHKKKIKSMKFLKSYEKYLKNVNALISVFEKGEARNIADAVKRCDEIEKEQKKAARRAATSTSSSSYSGGYKIDEDFYRRAKQQQMEVIGQAQANERAEMAAMEQARHNREMEKQMKTAVKNIKKIKKHTSDMKDLEWMNFMD